MKNKIFLKAKFQFGLKMKIRTFNILYLIFFLACLVYTSINFILLVGSSICYSDMEDKSCSCYLTKKELENPIKYKDILQEASNNFNKIYKSFQYSLFFLIASIIIFIGQKIYFK